MRFFERGLLTWKLLDSDGGAGTGGAEEGGQAGVNGQEDAAPEVQRSKRNPLAGVRYGRQPESATPVEEARKDDASEGKKPEDRARQWIGIRNGEYKAEFDADVQAILRERLKHTKAAEDKLTKLGPMLETLAKQYGKNADDLDGLIGAVTDDDKLYEEEAYQRGMSVDAVKQMHQIERERDEAQRAVKEIQERDQINRHIEGLVRQGEQVKQVFPSFDLQAELRNPDFARLTSPACGVDVMTAYQVIHRNEIQPMAMQVAAQKTQEKLANAIQAGQARPVENGLRARPAVEVRSDPKKFTRKDFAEIKRRVARGEKIEF